MENGIEPAHDICIQSNEGSKVHQSEHSTLDLLLKQLYIHILLSEY
jgi:hypothetical protein